MEMLIGVAADVGLRLVASLVTAGWKKLTKSDGSDLDKGIVEWGGDVISKNRKRCSMRELGPDTTLGAAPTSSVDQENSSMKVGSVEGAGCRRLKRES